MSFENTLLFANQSTTKPTLADASNASDKNTPAPPAFTLRSPSHIIRSLPEPWLKAYGDMDSIMVVAPDEVSSPALPLQTASPQTTTKQTVHKAWTWRRYNQADSYDADRVVDLQFDRIAKRLIITDDVGARVDIELCNIGDININNPSYKLSIYERRFNDCNGKVHFFEVSNNLEFDAVVRDYHSFVRELEQVMDMIGIQKRSHCPFICIQAGQPCLTRVPLPRAQSSHAFSENSNDEKQLFCIPLQTVKKLNYSAVSESLFIFNSPSSYTIWTQVTPDMYRALQIQSEHLALNFECTTNEESSCSATFLPIAKKESSIVQDSPLLLAIESKLLDAGCTIECYVANDQNDEDGVLIYKGFILGIMINKLKRALPHTKLYENIEDIVVRSVQLHLDRMEWSVGGRLVLVMYAQPLVADSTSTTTFGRLTSTSHIHTCSYVTHVSTAVLPNAGTSTETCTLFSNTSSTSTSSSSPNTQHSSLDKNDDENKDVDKNAELETLPPLEDAPAATAAQHNCEKQDETYSNPRSSATDGNISILPSCTGVTAKPCFNVYEQLEQLSLQVLYAPLASLDLWTCKLYDFVISRDGANANGSHMSDCFNSATLGWDGKSDPCVVFKHDCLAKAICLGQYIYKHKIHHQRQKHHLGLINFEIRRRILISLQEWHQHYAPKYLHNLPSTYTCSSAPSVAMPTPVVEPKK